LEKQKRSFERQKRLEQENETLKARLELVEVTHDIQILDHMTNMFVRVYVDTIEGKTKYSIVELCNGEPYRGRFLIAPEFFGNTKLTYKHFEKISTTFNQEDSMRLLHTLFGSLYAFVYLLCNKPKKALVAVCNVEKTRHLLCG
jgi:hypothetical protein